MLQLWPLLVVVPTVLFFASRWFSRPRLESPIRNINRPLEALRGLLALSVVFHHGVITYHYQVSQVWTNPHPYLFDLMGSGAVIVFFFLSGYLFWNQALSGRPILKKKDFYRQRFRRLLPAYYLAVALVVINAFISTRLHLNEPIWKVIYSILRWLFVGVPFGGFPNINEFEGTGRILAFVPWTLRFEMLFYLMLPFVWRFARVRSTLYLLGLFSLIYIFRPSFGLAVLTATVHDFSRFMVIGFGVGWITALFQARFSESTKAFFRSKWATVIVLLILIGLVKVEPQSHTLVQSLFLMPMFVAVVFGNDLFGFLSMPFLTQLGLVSYSLYLFHGVVFYFSSKFLGQLVAFSSMNEAFIWSWISLCACVAIVLSAVIYRKVEVRWMMK